MRDFEILTDVRSSKKIIDRAAYWLNCRSQTQAWLLVTTSVAAVWALDMATCDLAVNADAFYIVPISLACWMFKFRKAVDVTLAILLVSLFKFPTLSTDPSLFAALSDGIIRATAFTFLAAIVLSYRQVFDYAQSLATHDRMTGVYNKEAFNDRAQMMLDLARNGRCALLLVVVDLDGFKAVNDLHGHHAGDAVLQQFAAGVAVDLRQGDYFGRIGGDEFALLLPLEHLDTAKIVAGDLHRRLVAVLDRSSYRVTCSGGAVMVQAGDTVSYAELMRQADHLMYAAKRGGKNAMQIARAANLEMHDRSFVNVYDAVCS